MTIRYDQTEEETEAMLAKWLRHRAAAISALEKAAKELQARGGGSVVDDCFEVIQLLTRGK
jgi:hypothetical protein